MPSMSEHEVAHFSANRAALLRMMIEGYFLNNNVRYSIAGVYDLNLGEQQWLFEPGYQMTTAKGTFFLSMRGHIARLGTGGDPRDIARWIREDAGLQSEMSSNYDIVAYPSGTSRELISQVLGICNNAALPA